MTRRRLLVGLVVLAAGVVCTVAIAAAIGVTSAALGIHTKTLTSEQTCTLSSAEDAMTMQGNPNGTNPNPSLVTVYHQSDGTNTQDGWFGFDLGSCSFPANAVVDSASLQLTVQGTTSRSACTESPRAGALARSPGTTPRLPRRAQPQP